jgi:hypothetical protein
MEKKPKIKLEHIKEGVKNVTHLLLALISIDGQKPGLHSTKTMPLLLDR